MAVFLNAGRAVFGFADRYTVRGEGPSGLRTLEVVRGDDQQYCVCDCGQLGGGRATADLVAGRYEGRFAWSGRNWMGPSDTLNPLGPPFPPGTYRFEVVARGVYFEDGVEVSFETRGALEFELLP